MKVVFALIATALPYALGFGGSQMDSGSMQKGSKMMGGQGQNTPTLLGAPGPVASEPQTGTGTSVQSATPSGCGQNLNCWDCEGSNKCNWNINGCSTATKASNTNVCYNADPQSVPACTTHSDCTKCVYQQGCIFYNGQCKYSESGNCNNDPKCANTSSQCPKNDPCQSISDCGGCAFTNGCTWSSNTGKCSSNCTTGGCINNPGMCPNSYCNSYTSNGCSACTSQSGCVFSDGKCVQSSQPCYSSSCYNSPGQCPSTENPSGAEASGCATNGACSSCVSAYNVSGGKCAWQGGQCKDYCASGGAFCAQASYQC